MFPSPNVYRYAQRGEPPLRLFAWRRDRKQKTKSAMASTLKSNDEREKMEPPCLSRKAKKKHPPTLDEAAAQIIL